MMFVLSGIFNILYTIYINDALCYCMNVDEQPQGWEVKGFVPMYMWTTM